MAAGHSGDRHAGRDLGARVGYELLGAVDDPFAVLQLGPGLSVAGIGSRTRLGEAERPELAPGQQVWQQLALLLVGAEDVDGAGP